MKLFSVFIALLFLVSCQKESVLLVSPAVATVGLPAATPVSKTSSTPPLVCEQGNFGPFGENVQYLYDFQSGGCTGISAYVSYQAYFSQSPKVIIDNKEYYVLPQGRVRVQNGIYYQRMGNYDIPFLVDNPTAGQTWSSTIVTHKNPIPYEYEVMAVDGRCQTPAGSFREVVIILHQYGEREEILYYAKGVGLIKQEIKIPSYNSCQEKRLFDYSI